MPSHGWDRQISLAGPEVTMSFGASRETIGLLSKPPRGGCVGSGQTLSEEINEFGPMSARPQGTGNSITTGAPLSDSNSLKFFRSTLQVLPERATYRSAALLNNLEYYELLNGASGPRVPGPIFWGRLWADCGHKLFESGPRTSPKWPGRPARRI